MVRNIDNNKGQERPERATLRRSSEHKSKLTTASDLLASTMDEKRKEWDTKSPDHN